MSLMGGHKNQDFAPPTKCMDPPKKRLYKVWKGRNKFLCGGRLIFGPDGASVFLSTFLIGAPALTFCLKMFLRIPKLDFVYGHVVLIGGFVLTFLVGKLFAFQEKNVQNWLHIWYSIISLIVFFPLQDLIFLFMTSARNPGIVPRNSRPPDSDSTSTSMTSMEWINSATPELKLPKTKDVFVNGYTVRVKYCDTCMLYRPPRASHCSICNNCVQRFDHHCPWVGQCIGVRNYRTFILFVSTSTILCIYVFSFSLLNLLREPCHIWTAMSRDIVSVILIVYCFISVWFVGGLTVFHLYLICTNQTTYENFRYRYDKRENPYNQGIIKNLKEIFFSKTVPSLVNFREWVIEEDDSFIESVTRKFGGDIIKTNRKIDLELGILGKDGKPLPHILQNLDYNGIDDSLKKDKGGKVNLDPYFFPTDQEEKFGAGDRTVDDDVTDVSSRRTSSDALRR